MRVWVVSEKRHHEYPASRWVAEWRTFDGEPPDDFDPVCDTTCHQRSFGSKGKGLAIAFAKKKLGIDFFGCPIVFQESLEILEGDVAEWEDDKREPIYIE